MAKWQVLSITLYSKLRTQESPVKGKGKRRTQTMKTKLVLCVGSLVEIVTHRMFFQKSKARERNTQRI